jgi:hypothetical protein
VPGFPRVVTTLVSGTRFTVTTQAACTASLLYDANPGRVLAGRRAGSLPSTSLSTSHTFDLVAAGPGTWHFEVHLFDGGWRTICEDQGTPFCLAVPALAKYDPAAREALDTREPHERLEVLISLVGAAAARTHELEAAGLEVHSATGPVVSGVITLAHLRVLAALPFVRRVELGR